MTDPIVDAVCAKLQARSAVGINKYGTTLADNAATVKEKLIHAQEEAMDLANYLEWLLQEKEMPTPMTIEMQDERRAENSTGVQETGAADAELNSLSPKNDTTEKQNKLFCSDERQEADGSPIEALQMVCNAFKELKIYGVDELIGKIRAALQSPRFHDGYIKKEQADKFIQDSIDLFIKEGCVRSQVPVIEGLDEALNKYAFDVPDISDYQTVGEYMDDEAAYRSASARVEMAARAYAKLQKKI